MMQDDVKITKEEAAADLERVKRNLADALSSARNEPPIAELESWVTDTICDGATGCSRETFVQALYAVAAANGMSAANFVRLYNTYSYHPEITTENWFKVATPDNFAERLNPQFGKHLEEVAEAFPEITSDNDSTNAKMRMVKTLLDEIGDDFKTGAAKLTILNHEKFADSFIDQRVTGVGVAHLAQIDLPEAIARVNLANFSKFVEGVPVYKVGGTVAKGPYFVEPDLSGARKL